MKKIKLQFTGYFPYDFHWTNSSGKVYSAMETAGVYCVYKGKFKDGVVYIDKLLYIGQSKNIYNRLAGHKKFDEFNSDLKAGETLWIAFAEIKSDSDRERAENALIFKHRPPCNVASVNNFNYLPTKIVLTGDIAKLNKHFSVR